MHIRSSICVALGALISACGKEKAVEPPTTDPSLIGSAGGTIQSADGAARLVVPAGSLSSPVRLTLTPTNPTLVEAARAGALYQVGPAGTRFATAASLILPYNLTSAPDGAAEADLAAASLDGTTWTAIANSRPATPQAAQLTAPVTTAGTYGVIWSPAGTCPEPERRQFDYFLGRWRFETTGQPAGEQVMTVVGANCGVREAFTQGTYRGSSITLWNPTSKQWSQTYVDSDNGRRTLRGTLVNGALLLNETATVRYQWKPVGATQVELTEQRTTNGGASWNTTFTATYTLISR